MQVGNPLGTRFNYLNLIHFIRHLWHEIPPYFL
jgi:hypothetical protein